MQNNYNYWLNQILSAKTEHKDYLSQSKTLKKIYTDKKVFFNIFYSNVQILKSALLSNTPKPEVSRRFFNSLEKDSKKSNLYAIVSKIMQSAVEYYFDDISATLKVKEALQEQLITGRGVLWIEYIPQIVEINSSWENQLLGQNQKQEKIASHSIKISSLSPDDFLTSFAPNYESVLWQARRHLLTSEDLISRFNYTADDSELCYSSQSSFKDTEKKRAEVWEIWDKTSLSRIFILINSSKSQILESSKDPYKLSSFFPSVLLSNILKDNSIIPIPEYNLYKELDESLQELYKKNKDLESKIRYVSICSAKDSEKSLEIETASDGDIISVEDFNLDINNYIKNLDVSVPQSIIDRNQIRISQIKNDIFEITGISDIIRGATDPRETAQAQKIKGYFGGLRFRDRQANIQNAVKKIFSLVSELIAEHWDFETLSKISSVSLLSQQDKAILSLEQNNQDPNIFKLLNSPSSEDVIKVLRDDKMRDFVIDIESSATVFDDKEVQNQNIKDLTNIITTTLSQVNSSLSPDDIEVLIPLVKMNLASVKISSSISNALIDSLQKKIDIMRQNQSIPKPNQQELDRKQDFEINSIKLSNQKDFNDKKIELENKKLFLKQKELELEHVANVAKINQGSSPDTNLG